MPHVVLVGQANMDAIFGNLKSMSVRNEKGIFKTSDSYMNQERTAILIESLAIENAVNRGFLSLVSRRDDGVVVRIYPRLDIEKTTGVKFIIAEIAKQILGISPDLKIGETNLSDYFK